MLLICHRIGSLTRIKIISEPIQLRNCLCSLDSDSAIKTCQIRDSLNFFLWMMLYSSKKLVYKPKEHSLRQKCSRVMIIHMKDAEIKFKAVVFQTRRYSTITVGVIFFKVDFSFIYLGFWYASNWKAFTDIPRCTSFAIYTFLCINSRTYDQGKSPNPINNLHGLFLYGFVSRTMKATKKCVEFLLRTT